MLEPHYIRWERVHYDSTSQEKMKIGISGSANLREEKTNVFCGTSAPHPTKNIFSCTEEVDVVLVDRSTGADMIWNHSWSLERLPCL